MKEQRDEKKKENNESRAAAAQHSTNLTLSYDFVIQQYKCEEKMKFPETENIEIYNDRPTDEYDRMERVP